MPLSPDPRGGWAHATSFSGRRFWKERKRRPGASMHPLRMAAVMEDAAEAVRAGVYVSMSCV